MTEKTVMMNKSSRKKSKKALHALNESLNRDKVDLDKLAVNVESIKKSVENTKNNETEPNKNLLLLVYFGNSQSSIYLRTSLKVYIVEDFESIKK